jgi:hypothetical protein
MVEDWLNVLADWILIPFIIIYGFISWSRDNPDKKIFMDPEDNKKDAPKTETTPEQNQDNDSTKKY